MKRKKNHLAPARRLARHLGIPILVEKPTEDKLREFSWNGQRILVFRNETLSNALHEIAHWVVAPEKRRGLPEYGLGSSPSSWKDAPLMVADADREERLASVLGILLEARLGMPFEGSLEDHNWIKRGEFLEVVRELQKKKFLRGLRPVCLPEKMGKKNSRLIRGLRSDDNYEKLINPRGRVYLF